VRRRTWFVVAAAMTASLAVGTGMAMAAGSHTSATKLTCRMSLGTVPPADSNAVNQPPASGSQYGAVHCPKAGFGGGIMGDSFKVPDTGDIVGKFTQYFRAGSISGSFDAAPQESGTFGASSFAGGTWVGTVKITGGTGVYNAIKGKKGTGVFKCTSPDSVHLACTEKIRLTAV
jgi:hypothetical protein